MQRRRPSTLQLGGLSLAKVAKGLREVPAMQSLSLLQLGMQYQSRAYSLSFKVISVENSLTAGTHARASRTHTVSSLGDTKIGTRGHRHSATHTPLLGMICVRARVSGRSVTAALRK